MEEENYGCCWKSSNQKDQKRKLMGRDTIRQSQRTESIISGEEICVSGVNSNQALL